MISIKKIIAEILSDGYALFGTVNKDKQATIVVDGYYPIEQEGGGWIEDGDDGWKELHEIMQILSLAGVMD